MNWEQKAIIVCERKGLEIVPYGFEDGWIFIKDKNKKIYPISEHIVAKWVKEMEC